MEGLDQGSDALEAVVWKENAHRGKGDSGVPSEDVRDTEWQELGQATTPLPGVCAVPAGLQDWGH